MNYGIMDRQTHAEYLFLMWDIYESLKKRGQNPTEETMSQYVNKTVDELREIYASILINN